MMHFQASCPPNAVGRPVLAQQAAFRPVHCFPPPRPVLCRAADSSTGSTGASQNGASTTDSSSNPSPSTSGLTVKQKLDQLAAAKQKSVEALTQEAYNPYYRASMGLGAGIVDIKLYQNALDSQKRLSAKLSETTAYISQLEQKLETTSTTVEVASEFLKKMSLEFGTTSRLAKAAGAAMRFGVDKEEAVEKMLKLCERLKNMEDAVNQQRSEYSRRVVQRVPVAWVGVASEVKLMGDFDNWTRGFELSAGDIDSDGVYKTFEAQVPLMPGRYRVKLMVDGQWRIASDWPTENDEHGETNNILVVTAKM